jgi:hypothetical protein
MDNVDDLRLAAEALAALVRNEYPSEYTLTEIASTWGEGISDEQIEGLRRTESLIDTRS